MPCLPYSIAAAFASPATPCLAATYAGPPATPSRPANDEVQTIAPPPPCFSICAISALRQSHTPVRLIPITRFQFSSEHLCVSAASPSMPALLNAQSSRPKAWTACATALSTSADFDTSVLQQTAAAPALVTVAS